jgi:L-ribulokinase
VHVPEIENPTCVGAAIHGAVAAGVVVDFREGSDKFGAHHLTLVELQALADLDNLQSLLSTRTNLAI